jgi:hypothetical protein
LNVFLTLPDGHLGDALFEPEPTAEQKARRRLVEAQAAYDAASAHLNGASDEEKAGALAALRRARDALHQAGRELRAARDSGSPQ